MTISLRWILVTQSWESLVTIRCQHLSYCQALPLLHINSVYGWVDVGNCCCSTLLEVICALLPAISVVNTAALLAKALLQMAQWSTLPRCSCLFSMAHPCNEIASLQQFALQRFTRSVQLLKFHWSRKWDCPAHREKVLLIKNTLTDDSDVS